MRWQKNTCKFVCKSFEKKKVDVGRISTREDFLSSRGEGSSKEGREAVRASELRLGIR